MGLQVFRLNTISVFVAIQVRDHKLVKVTLISRRENIPVSHEVRDVAPVQIEFITNTRRGYDLRLRGSASSARGNEAFYQ